MFRAAGQRPQACSQVRPSGMASAAGPTSSLWWKQNVKFAHPGRCKFSVRPCPVGHDAWKVWDRSEKAAVILAFDLNPDWFDLHHGKLHSTRTEDCRRAELALAVLVQDTSSVGPNGHNFSGHSSARFRVAIASPRTAAVAAMKLSFIGIDFPVVRRRASSAAHSSERTSAVPSDRIAVTRPTCVGRL